MDELDRFIQAYNASVLSQPRAVPASAVPETLAAEPERSATPLPVPAPPAVQDELSAAIAGTPLERAIQLGNQAVAGVMEAVVPSPLAQEELGPIVGNLPSSIWDLASLPYMADQVLRSIPLSAVTAGFGPDGDPYWLG